MTQVRLRDILRNCLVFAVAAILFAGFTELLWIDARDYWALIKSAVAPIIGHISELGIWDLIQALSPSVIQVASFVSFFWLAVGVLCLFVFMLTTLREIGRQIVRLNAYS